MTWLAQHRTICEVIEEIKLIAANNDDYELFMLCEEAMDYAQRMSERLQEYKKKEEAVLASEV